MKPTFCVFILLAIHLASSEYPRLKYRGPPSYPKPPPFQQFAKKWQHPPRPPVRSRPIPVHMPNHHKIQMGVSGSVNRPVALPVRNFWKNTQTTFKTPIETHYMTSAPVPPKKSFQGSPPILAQEYDFQVQSNNIAGPIKTIKQIGEKGPIHTIPAPNLSPADKPLIIEEVKPQKPPPPVLVEERLPEIVSYVQIQKAHQYQVTEAPELTKPTFYNPYHPQPQNLSPNEIYQLLSALPQQPSTLAVPVAVQDSPQDYLQQFPTLVPQQPQQNYIEQQVIDKSSFEEQTEADVSESIVHSQYVQNYFDTKDDVNQVEPDAKSSNNNSTQEGYYVSLPNKEAAETLASLQAAGKLNSNLMNLAQHDLPVSIYVSDEGDERQEREEEVTYDDYNQDDLVPEENHGNEGFGQRLRPKI